MTPIGPKGFLSHEQYVESVLTAKFSDFVNRPTFSANDASTFEKMRQHLLGLADSVEAQHSFVDEHGQAFDCVPVEQQPSLKQNKIVAATPVNLDVPKSLVSNDRVLVPSPLGAGKMDKFGNEMLCPPGTVPVRRLTMEELSRFGTLQEFFRKPPVGKGRPPSVNLPEAGAEVHKYAYGYQNVANLGGHSFLNVWDPAVGSQMFSLTQQWYTAGDPVQTVECGWQVYPQKYQTTKPVIFVYWTGDGYQATGSYNTDNIGFVLQGSSWPLGMALGIASADGGQQAELEITCTFVAGNWWVYVNGTTSNDTVGYFPGALYGAGPMATGAASITYGGEVVNQTAWPPMGSGAFANAGYEHAAYQRDISYFDMGSVVQAANLAPVQGSPNCYTINSSVSPDPWNANFFYGGPGGNACS